MNWENVYTASQREKLIEGTLKAFDRFNEWLSGHKFSGEVEIAGFYGEKTDKLVLMDGQVLEKYWSFESEGFVYKDTEIGRRLILRYDLTPEHFDKTRRAVEAKIHETADTEPESNEQDSTVQELKELLYSQPVGELIRPVPFSGALILTRDGLVEKTITGHRVIPDEDLSKAVAKYSIDSDVIRRVREILETK